MTPAAAGEDTDRADIAAWLRGHAAAWGLELDDRPIVPLPGHASAKQFYRVHLRGGATLLAMLGCSTDTDYLADPPPPPGRHPFVAIGRFLQAGGVRVPAIIGHYPDIDCILLQDLGDRSLSAVLAGSGAPRRLALMHRALDPIVRIAALTERGRAELDEKIGARVMDRETIAWELEHYRIWCLEGHQRAKLTAVEDVAIRRCFDTITQELVSAGCCLAHRDYHASNLMVDGEDNVAVIDFQDLAVCSSVYDVASLLYDVNSSPYVSEAMRIELIDGWRRMSGHEQDDVDFHRLIGIQGLQRCLKGAGRFAWLAANWGKIDFLRDIPAALRMALDLCDRYSDLTPLADVIRRHAATE